MCDYTRWYRMIDKNRILTELGALKYNIQTMTVAITHEGFMQFTKNVLDLIDTVILKVELNQLGAKKEAKDIMETEPFHIKIEVPGRGVEVNVVCIDPNDAVIISGKLLMCLRIDLHIDEPTTKVMP